jgi:hypothetical protein
MPKEISFRKFVSAFALEPEFWLLQRRLRRWCRTGCGDLFGCFWEIGGRCGGRGLYIMRRDVLQLLALRDGAWAGSGTDAGAGRGTWALFSAWLGRSLVACRAERLFLGSRRGDSHVFIGDVARAGILKLNEAVSHPLAKQFHTGLCTQGNVRRGSLYRALLIERCEATGDLVFGSLIGIESLRRTGGKNQQARREQNISQKRHHTGLLSAAFAFAILSSCR